MRSACGLTSGGEFAARLLGRRLLRDRDLRPAVVLLDEVAHLRVHDVAPAAAAEDAVVAGALHLDVLLARLRHARAQLVRGLRLARAGDVVELAFAREVRGGL